MDTPKKVAISLLVGALILSCGGVVNSTCGEGTYDDNGTCRPLADGSDGCGSGSTLTDGQCVSADGGFSSADASTTNRDSGASSSFDASASPDSGFGIDTSTACLQSDNTFVIAGNDWVYTGSPLVVEGGSGWSVNVQHSVDGLPSWVEIDVGSNWHLNFSSESLGLPLAKGNYDHAENAYATDPNRPGLYVAGGGACDQVDGSFTVLEMTADADAGYPNVASFTASWEQHCVEGTGSTVGCVHFVQ